MRLYTVQDVELCGNRIMHFQRYFIFTTTTLSTDDIKSSHKRDPDRFPIIFKAIGQGAKFPPIVVDRDNKVMDGNTRLSASTENGAKELTVFKVVGELYTV